MLHKLEIEYLFEKEQTCWFYFQSDCVKYETAVERAEKHFKQLVSNSGWTKKVTLVAIRPMKHANDPPPTLTADDSTLSSARSSSSNNTRATAATTRKKRATKTPNRTRKAAPAKPAAKSTTTRAKGSGSGKGTTKRSTTSNTRNRNAGSSNH